jgi:hypothetical protein
MVCRRIHESLEQHQVKSDYDVGSYPNMHRVASAFKSQPHTAHLNTQFPRGHKKHHGMI